MATCAKVMEILELTGLELNRLNNVDNEQHNGNTRGLYDNTSTYNRGDIVQVGDDLFYCMADGVTGRFPYQTISPACPYGVVHNGHSFYYNAVSKSFLDRLTYNATTTYNKGDSFYDELQNVVFYVIVNNVTGIAPPILTSSDYDYNDDSKWAHYGYSNAMRIFDLHSVTKTIATGGSLQITVAMNRRFTHLVLQQIDGDTVDYTLKQNSGAFPTLASGTVVLDDTSRRALIIDLTGGVDTINDRSVFIDIQRATGKAGLGLYGLANEVEIGTLTENGKITSKSFRAITHNGFGISSIEKGATAPTITVKSFCYREEFDSIKYGLDSIIGKMACVHSYNEFDTAISYGFARSYDFDLQDLAKIGLTFTLEALDTKSGKIIKYQDRNTNIEAVSNDSVCSPTTTTTTTTGGTGTTYDDTEVRTLIQSNTDNITANATDINTNLLDIATNKNNITSNANNIATNATGIANNANNITTNANKITTNTNDIATNVSDIATNASDIDTNTTNILNNSVTILKMQEKASHFKLSNTSIDAQTGGAFGTFAISAGNYNNAPVSHNGAGGEVTINTAGFLTINVQLELIGKVDTTNGNVRVSEVALWVSLNGTQILTGNSFVSVPANTTYPDQAFRVNSGFARLPVVAGDVIKIQHYVGFIKTNNDNRSWINLVHSEM